MNEDETPYLPEPASGPLGVLGAPERKEAREESPRTRPVSVVFPGVDARTLAQHLADWAAQRQVVQRVLTHALRAGGDAQAMRTSGVQTPPPLSAAGVATCLALLQLHATFRQDSATWTMLGEPVGTLCFVCTLSTRGGELVGEGRGVQTLHQAGGDITAAVHRAQHASCVDALLRTGFLDGGVPPARGMKAHTPGQVAYAAWRQHFCAYEHHPSGTVMPAPWETLPLLVHLCWETAADAVLALADEETQP